MKFISLQALRAIAAIAVVVHHAQGLCHKYAAHPSWSEELMHGAGQYGVDLFFVLSGFVIFYAIHQTHATPGDFLRRRLIRIVPIYWILTLSAVALPFLLPAAFSAPPTLPPARIVLESLCFVSYALYTRTPILHVGWTIEYEMLFYGLAAAALFAALPLYRTLGWIFVAVYACSHFLIPDAASPGTVVFFLGNPVVFEFVLGLLLGQLLLQRRMVLQDAAIPLAAVILTIAAEGGNRFVFAGLPAVGIVWVALKTEQRTSRYRITRALARVGDASYSIYLLQTLALPGIGKVAARYVPALYPDLLVLIATILVVIAGILLYRSIERPLLKALRPVLASEQVKIVELPQAAKL